MKEVFLEHQQQHADEMEIHYQELLKMCPGSEVLSLKDIYREVSRTKSINQKLNKSGKRNEKRNA